MNSPYANTFILKDLKLLFLLAAVLESIKTTIFLLIIPKIMQKKESDFWLPHQRALGIDLAT